MVVLFNNALHEDYWNTQLVDKVWVNLYGKYSNVDIKIHLLCVKT